MYLVYLDEVKYQEGTEPYYWLCGIAFPEESILSVEARVSELAKDYFGSSILSKDTEFHATDIVHGKGPYKGQDMEGRVNLFCALIDIIDECQGLNRIEVRIDPAKMVTEGHEEKAFMFFVERVEGLMCKNSAIAMLISDHDKDMVSSNVASLSAYKAYGTDYYFGIDITHIIDTIHHTHSHHSRLVQLVDIYAYSMALCPKQELKFPKSKILEHIKNKKTYGFPSTYKYWPTVHSWYKR